MAALTHGPRLGAPSATGFKAWICADGAGTCVLQTRLTGTTTWTTQDTQAVDTSKQNTCVLTATGLNARTKYDYRVNIDGVDGTTYTTITMPPNGGGRFVVYQTTDCHDAPTPFEPDDALAVYTAILDDYETNYEPLGIPAFVVQYGDLWTMGSFAPTTSTFTADDVFNTYFLPSIAKIDIPGTLRKLPWLYMWDDWDYGGNNSASATNVYNHASVVDKVAEARKIADWGWREHTFPCAPALSYKYEVAGVPFIVLDLRSERRHTTTTQAFPYADANYTCLGATQKAWLKTTLRSYGQRALVVAVSGTTVKDPVVPYRLPYNIGGTRDSVGLYFRAERNEILRDIASSGYAWRNNLFFWTGDDHYNSVWTGTMAPETRSPGTLSLPLAPSYDPCASPVPYKEFKVSSRTVYATNAGNSPVVFGPGDWLSYADKAAQSYGTEAGLSCFVRWDITASDNGEHARARIQYVIARVGENNVFGQSVGEVLVDDEERTADFYFEDGYFNYYSATPSATAISQLYPVENGVADTRTGERWYVDEINGHLFPESRAVRDDDRRLRDRKDIGDVDRDWLLKYWRPRRELPDREL